MNLKKLRDDNIPKKFENLVTKNNNLPKNKKFKFSDQDILNISCFNNIKTLPFKYNAMTHADINNDYKDSEYAQSAFTQQDWDESRNNPLIVHFTIKPFEKNKKQDKYFKQWWETVSKTGFQEEILKKYDSNQ